MIRAHSNTFHIDRENHGLFSQPKPYQLQVFSVVQIPREEVHLSVTPFDLTTDIISQGTWKILDISAVRMKYSFTIYLYRMASHLGISSTARPLVRAQGRVSVLSRRSARVSVSRVRASEEQGTIIVTFHRLLLKLDP